MKKLALVPMRQLELLPEWRVPKNLDEAAATISELGRDMHEHAYLLGRTLSWVKKEVGHGEFDGWIKRKVWFGRATAYRMMSFANRCEKAGKTIEYHPNRLTVRRLPTKKTDKSELDPRPPGLRCYFELAERLEAVFFDLKKDEQTDLLLSLRELLKNLESKAGETI